ncbi:hypothetical protein ACFVP3_23405 [Streptomyces sp. NPDC057806]|uniref:hypothetical protein n=1 Tax=Streptomyces sp. NPDC057806 TaxID=3346255 RepID=UPI0036A1917C
MTDPITFGRPFVLRRDRDISGVSGTGVILDGVLWPDGQAAIHWRGKWALTTPHPDGMDSILDIHDHGGQGDLHVIWADEVAAARREGLADIVEAYDLPVALFGTEAEKTYLHRTISRALLKAWEARASTIDQPEGHCAEFADAAMPIVRQLLEQRDRAKAAAGRAYMLADQWQAAHGSAAFLVRVAGSELRDVLDDDQADTPLAPDEAPPDATCRVMETRTCPESYAGPCGDRPCARFESDDPTPWFGTTVERAVDAAEPKHCDAPGHGSHLGFTCAEVDQTKPYWNDRWTHEPAADATAPATTCSARYTGVLPVGECIRAAGHIPFTDHTDDRGRHWGDRLAEYQAPQNQGPLTGIEVRDPCPYCTGAPLFPRAELGGHVQATHASVLAVLAAGGSLDEQLDAPETRCRLPHEMEA